MFSLFLRSLKCFRQNDAVESRILRDKQREESRAERQRKYERDEWEKDVIAAEADIGLCIFLEGFPLQYFPRFFPYRFSSLENTSFLVPMT